jgi:pyruvate ferredoxin oxidoreductase gamma subunit
MHRIRFHGRGGQGMKTASRIVGTAAFRQGFYAQDFPVYGAERRGAPVTSFTRFDEGPVLERGVVAFPDIVVIADETLLRDELVRPLVGLSSAGTALFNSVRTAEDLREEHAIKGGVVALDFTSLALTYTGSIAALSVAIGAAAARIAGLQETSVEQAVREELTTLVSDPARLERNIHLAGESFRTTPLPVIVTLNDGASSGASYVRLVTPIYRGGWAGTASVASTPNTSMRKTGDWRVRRPVIDLARCTHCWVCFVNCPDGAISLDAGNIPKIDYGVCKGCMLCVEECPIDAIESVREVL